ncbi:hypothetical protein C8Q73DRAFT_794998 [Cubamyces lactineus]|nr:hypothetical protein C8Q73DRAFT_794998 [Cubamyces lactineus]
MSQYPPTNAASNTFTTQPPPSHHLHGSSDPLPGARGAAPAAPNYSADVTNDSRVWQDRNQREFGPGSDTAAVMAGGQHSAGTTGPGKEASAYDDNTMGKTAFNEDRPLGVQPTERGGVAIGGDPDLPEGKAKMTDKIIGKTQKVTGKVMGNAAMHEKGELREAGGKAAAQGQARAPHD